MKKLLFLTTLFTSIVVQNIHAQETQNAAVSPLLISYYSLKDALVNSNTNAAATHAVALAKTINEAGKETINDETRKTLLSNALAISQSKDLQVQREKFASLSATMLILAKATKLSPSPVYLQYCPMKKASWLSNDKAIKNPYYGNAMLTCGSVKETL